MCNQLKRNAVAEYLISECNYTREEVKDLKISNATYDTNVFIQEEDSREFLVLTDNEAYTYVQNYILSTLWACSPEFLAKLTKLDSKVFTMLAPLCDDSNEALKVLISGTCGLDLFVQTIIEADGRGNYLASYDGEEFKFNDYYVYRIDIEAFVLTNNKMS